MNFLEFCNEKSWTFELFDWRCNVIFVIKNTTVLCKSLLSFQPQADQSKSDKMPSPIATLATSPFSTPRLKPRKCFNVFFLSFISLVLKQNFANAFIFALILLSDLMAYEIVDARKSFVAKRQKSSVLRNLWSGTSRFIVDESLRALIIHSWCFTSECNKCTNRIVLEDFGSSNGKRDWQRSSWNRVWHETSSVYGKEHFPTGKLHRWMFIKESLPTVIFIPLSSEKLSLSREVLHEACSLPLSMHKYK